MWGICGFEICSLISLPAMALITSSLLTLIWESSLYSVGVMHWRGLHNQSSKYHLPGVFKCSRANAMRYGSQQGHLVMGQVANLKVMLTHHVSADHVNYVSYQCHSLINMNRLLWFMHIMKKYGSNPNWWPISWQKHYPLQVITLSATRPAD